MTMKKLIEVYNGINKTYYCRCDLNAFGLSFRKTEKYSGKWVGKADEDKANAIKEYCIKNKLRVNITDLAYTRAHNYREVYFENNKGIFGDGRYYHCVYCGKILKKDKVTVDHFFPINKVKNSPYSSINIRLLKKFGIEDINDKRNLVCACKSCNSSKGSKGGIWLVRGYLGRFFILWVLFYTLLLYFIGYYLIYAFNCFIK